MRHSMKVTMNGLVIMQFVARKSATLLDIRVLKQCNPRFLYSKWFFLQVCRGLLRRVYQIARKPVLRSFALV